jgi:Tfp pilus assembly protein PilN
MSFQNQLSIANSTKSRLVGELQEAEDFLVQSIHSFVFARLLQELVPLDVQLKDYSLSTSGISLEASSYSQQSINDFIVFFSAHPLIQQDSVKVADLSTTTAFTDPQATATDATQQPRQFYTLKLTAMYQNPNEAELYKLLAKAGNTGLLNKLREISPQAQL